MRAVILLSVAVSATTTFLTMRQSAKRGMMNQQMPDPDQPGAAMAQSMSKNMMYIAPFFALTGLYWQYGLVIYWVTTNVWTLGQQHILFRNLPIVGSVGAGAATSAASRGNSGVVGSAPIKSSLAAAKGSGSAKTATKTGTTTRPSTTTKSGTATKAGTATKPTTTGATKPTTAGATKPTTAGATKPSTTGATKPTTAGAYGTASANGAAAKPKFPAAKTASARRRPNRPPTPRRTAVWSAPRTGSGGRGLLGFGKKKPEPEEAPVVPETKVVRQQPVRQARAKRSGSSGTSGKR